MSDRMTHRQFAECVGDLFSLPLGEGRCGQFELVDATLLATRNTPARSEPFSLVFRAGDAALLPQRIYRLEHPRLGLLDIFLVPIGPDEHGMCYEAIFN